MDNNNTPTTAGQAPATTPGQPSAPTTPTPTTTTAPASSQALWVDGSPYDPQRAKETVDKLHARVKEAEAKAKDYDRLVAEEQKRKEADMSEAEKAQARLTEYEAKEKAWALRERELVTKPLLENAAEKAGMAEKGAIWSLADHSLIEYDERNGEPTQKSLDKAIDAVRERYPRLFVTEQQQHPANPNNQPKPPSVLLPVNPAKGQGGAAYDPTKVKLTDPGIWDTFGKT